MPLKVLLVRIFNSHMLRFITAPCTTESVSTNFTDCKIRAYGLCGNFSEFEKCKSELN